MENKDKPAFPMDATYNSEFVGNGLTKREYMAAMIIQGLCSNPVHSQKWTFTFRQRIRNFLGMKATVKASLANNDDLARIAIGVADELLKQLEQ